MKDKIKCMSILCVLLVLSSGFVISANAIKVKSVNATSYDIYNDAPKISKVAPLVKVKQEFYHMPDLWTLPDYPVLIESIATIKNTDLDEDEMRFMIDFGDGQTSTWIDGDPYLSPFNSKEWIFSIEHSYSLFAWENSRTFSIRVRVDSTFYEQSDWSEPVELLVVKNPYKEEFEIGMQKPWLSPPSTEDESDKNILVCKLPYIKIKGDINWDGPDITLYNCEKDFLDFDVKLTLNENDNKYNILTKTFKFELAPVSGNNYYSRKISDGNHINFDIYNIENDEDIGCDFEFELVDPYLKIYLPKDINPDSITSQIIFPEVDLPVYFNYDHKFFRMKNFICFTDKDIDPGITIEAGFSKHPPAFMYLTASGIKEFKNLKDFIIYAKYPESSKYTISVYFGDNGLWEGKKTIDCIQPYDHITDVEIEIKRRTAKAKTYPIFRSILSKFFQLDI